VCTSPHPRTCHMPRPSILLDLITRIISGEALRSRSSCMQSRPLPCHLVPLRPNFLSTLFSNTLCVCSSLCVTAHPCQTASKIIVLYILLFIFSDTKLEDNFVYIWS
jgi:hypothetical protein